MIKNNKSARLFKRNVFKASAYILKRPAVSLSIQSSPDRSLRALFCCAFLSGGRERSPSRLSATAPDRGPRKDAGFAGWYAMGPLGGRSGVGRARDYAGSHLRDEADITVIASAAMQSRLIGLCSGLLRLFHPTKLRFVGNPGMRLAMTGCYRVIQQLR